MNWPTMSGLNKLVIFNTLRLLPKFRIACASNLYSNYDMAEEYLKHSLLLSRDIGHNLREFQCLCSLSVLKVSLFHSYLFKSIEKLDTARFS